MKTDINGLSTCPIGEEQYELMPYRRDTRIQYDYRDVDGELFSGIFENLEKACKERNNWRKEKYKDIIYKQKDKMDILEKLKKWTMKRTKEAKESYLQANGTVGEAYASGKVSAFGDMFDKIERMQRTQMEKE
jgi:hypothetical protein